MSDELKACPWCHDGGKPQLCPAMISADSEVLSDAVVECVSCGATGPYDTDGHDDVAIARWNTRPSISEEKVEEMANEINQAIFANTGCGVAQLARMDVLGILSKHLSGEVK